MERGRKGEGTIVAIGEQTLIYNIVSQANLFYVQNGEV